MIVSLDFLNPTHKQYNLSLKFPGIENSGYVNNQCCYTGEQKRNTKEYLSDGQHGCHNTTKRLYEDKRQSDMFDRTNLLIKIQDIDSPKQCHGYEDDNAYEACKQKPKVYLNPLALYLIIQF